MDYRYFLILLPIFGVILVVSKLKPTQQVLKYTELISIEQIHLQYGQKGSINIIWVSQKPFDICYIDFFHFQVYNPDIEQLSYYAQTQQYTRYIYNITTHSLHPHKIYDYQIICTQEDYKAASDIFKFKSPPLTHSPVRILSVADWSIGYTSDPNQNYSKIPKPNILPHLFDLDGIDFIIHAGDYAYDLNSLDGKMGDRFMNALQPLVAQIPYQTAAGNHESNTHFQHYRKLFKQQKELYYSYEIGNTHFCIIDTESYVGRFHTEEMLKQHQNWIEQDLQTAQQPFKIVIGHRPLYCNPNPECRVCTSACVQYSKTLIEYLEPVFIKNQVDLYISGDVHLYERSQPLYQNKSTTHETFSYYNQKGTVYLVNGVAGSFDPIDDPTFPPTTPMNWTVAITDKLGYGLIDIFNSTHLRYQQFSIGNSQFDDIEAFEQETPKLFDEFWIIKS